MPYFAQSCFTATITILDEPYCFSTVTKFCEWRDTMNNEFQALQQNQTWSLVPPISTINVLGCQWVYRTNTRVDGSFEKR